MKCRTCNGRGWYIGDCHPREGCGACDATGAVPDEPCACKYPARVTPFVAPPFCNLCGRTARPTDDTKGGT